MARIFRVVSNFEASNIALDSGFESVYGAYEDKLFTTSIPAAMHFARLLYLDHEENCYLISVDIPEDLYNSLWRGLLDGRESICYRSNQLDLLNQSYTNLRIEYVIEEDTE